MDIRRVARDELGDAKRLLEEAGLGALPDSFSLANVLVGLEKDEIVGVVALDVSARTGFSRWLVVRPDHRKKGCGKSLVRGLVTRGQELGLRELYLLVEGSESFFLELGFRSISSEDIAREIRVLPSYLRDNESEEKAVVRMGLETRV